MLVANVQGRAFLWTQTISLRGLQGVGSKAKRQE